MTNIIIERDEFNFGICYILGTIYLAFGMLFQGQYIWNYTIIMKLDRSNREGQFIHDKI